MNSAISAVNMVTVSNAISHKGKLQIFTGEECMSRKMKRLLINGK